MIPVNLTLTQRPLQTGEYRHSNGLIYCSSCHTPREKRIRAGDMILQPRCLCRCQAEEAQHQEQARRHREFLDTVARNRSVGLPDPELRKHTFGNDLGCNPKQTALARRYAENFAQFREKAVGLLFWGNVGTGKSFLAGCIANALLDKGVPVIMTNFTRLLNQLSDFRAGDRNACIDSYNAYPLMIIDDLGVERNSEFTKEQVFSIIDSRYRSGLPLIVTTNLTLQELKDPKDLGRARIYDRILERCIPVKVNGRNLRQENRAANLEQARTLLAEA